MARLGLLAALLALAPAAGAQTHIEASPGLFLVVDNLDPLQYGDSQVGLDAEAGWRFASGWDAGVGLGLGLTDHSREAGRDTFGATRSGSLGLSVGYTHALGERAGLRLATGAGVGRTVIDRRPTERTLSGRVVGDDSRSFNGNDAHLAATVGAFRRVSVGRLVVQPTLLAEAVGTVSSVTPSGEGFRLRTDAELGTATFREVRVGVGVPVSAQVLGRLVTVETRTVVDVESGRPDTRLRFRLN